MLFGHKKGAFTGADETTLGYIGEANGGILFLDEIHALSEDCQRRLLRVLNDGTYNRVGDSKTLHSEFQVLVASTKDLDDEVEAGRFLLDLRGRLTGLQISLLPLRARLSDLPELIEIGLARLGTTVNSPTLNELAARCKRYYWQGNVRQLMQVLNIMVTESFGDEREISADDLPELKTMFAPGAHSDSGRSSGKYGNLMLDELQSLIITAIANDTNLDALTGAMERLIITEAYKRHGSVRGVAEALGITRVKAKRAIGKDLASPIE
jgi:DNA-binding NtrC family response regulator